MVGIKLTGINFQYQNGYNSSYTSVNLNFNSTGATFNLSGYIAITPEQYTAANGDLAALTTLVKNSITSTITGA